VSTATAVRSRGALVLDHLAAHPGLTAGELGRVLGIPGQLRETLRRLEQKAQVVSVTRWDPDQGREVSRWRIAPPGIVPPPRTGDPEAAARRKRERDRLTQRARRARARGLAVQPGMEPPSLRSVPAVAADLPGAACRAADPDLFFGPDGERQAERQARGEKARAVCAGCPVRRRCFEQAVANGERWGIWGGVDFEVTARATGRKEAQAS
jgi:WhiB family transcriptional regulator, redox-sensing transcriptional regulator